MKYNITPIQVTSTQPLHSRDLNSTLLLLNSITHIFTSESWEFKISWKNFPLCLLVSVLKTFRMIYSWELKHLEFAGCMSNIISTGVVWRRTVRHLFLAQKVFLKVVVNRHSPVKSFASRCSYDSAQRFVKGIDYMMITMFEHIVCISKWRNWLLNSLHSIGFPPDITHLPQWLQGCLWKEGLHNLAPWTL